MPNILQLLKRRRKKLNLVEKLAGVYKSSGWRKIEDRVLGLIQLWADTFMMQEDAFPVFMRAYRELRQEGIKFPQRDSNERFMIKFEGEPSPAFELADIEQVGNVSNSNNSRSNSKVEENKRKGNQDQEDPKLFESDIQSIKESFTELANILCRARDVKELQEPRSKEFIRRCRAGQKKLLWVVSSKTENTDEESVVELLGVMEYINNRMEDFKKAAGILKRGGSSNEIKELLKENKQEKTGSPLDLLDLADDFLEVEVKNPLDCLEKFVYGREIKKEIKPPRIEETKEKNREEEEEKKSIEVVKKIEHPRRLEQPDLLFLDVEPTPTVINPNQNLLDLHTLQISPIEPSNPNTIYNPNPAHNPNFNPNYNPNYSQNMIYNQNPGYNQNMSYNPNQINNPPSQLYNPYPSESAKPQNSIDDFEDFFSDLANRKAV